MDENSDTEQKTWHVHSSGKKETFLGYIWMSPEKGFGYCKINSELVASREDVNVNAVIVIYT